MSSYVSQTIIIGSVPVGFNNSLLSTTPLKLPKRAFGIVEGSDIRVSSSELPTTTSGLLATTGSAITITGEQDIENFKAISTNPSISAHIYFEFSDE